MEKLKDGKTYVRVTKMKTSLRYVYSAEGFYPVFWAFTVIIGYLVTISTFPLLTYTLATIKVVLILTCFFRKMFHFWFIIPVWATFFITSLTLSSLLVLVKTEDEQTLVDECLNVFTSLQPWFANCALTTVATLTFCVIWHFYVERNRKARTELSTKSSHGVVDTNQQTLTFARYRPTEPFFIIDHYGKEHSLTSYEKQMGIIFVPELKNLEAQFNGIDRLVNQPLEEFRLHESELSNARKNVLLAHIKSGWRLRDNAYAAMKKVPNPILLGRHDPYLIPHPFRNAAIAAAKKAQPSDEFIFYTPVNTYPLPPPPAVYFTIANHKQEEADYDLISAELPNGANIYMDSPKWKALANPKRTRMLTQQRIRPLPAPSLEVKRRFQRQPCLLNNHRKLSTRLYSPIVVNSRRIR